LKAPKNTINCFSVNFKKNRAELINNILIVNKQICEAGAGKLVRVEGKETLGIGMGTALIINITVNKRAALALTFSLFSKGAPIFALTGPPRGGGLAPGGEAARDLYIFIAIKPKGTLRYASLTGLKLRGGSGSCLSPMWGFEALSALEGKG
jgi:hypothetical protein